MIQRPPGCSDRTICRTWWEEDRWAEIRYLLWHRFFCSNCKATNREKAEHVDWLREQGQ